MEFKVILEFDQDESCWASYVPALDNISTWGRTREEALKNTEEMITGYLEALRKEGLPWPKPRVFELEDVVVAM